MAGFAPWPGATRRDALLELLSTPGISTDITAPFYDQFLQDRQAAQQSRTDYLSNLLSMSTENAQAGMTERQTSMLMDAIQAAYGVRPGSPVGSKSDAIVESLYPEYRNPLRQMPGGVSPLSTTAPVDYEDMLQLNREVKDAVAAGKTLWQTKNDLINQVQSRYENPNVTTDEFGNPTTEYVLPENWAAIQASMENIIERAYKAYSATPGAPEPQPAPPAPAPTGVGEAVRSAWGDVSGALETAAPYAIGGYGMYRALRGLSNWQNRPTPIGALPPMAGTTPPDLVGHPRGWSPPMRVDTVSGPTTQLGQYTLDKLAETNAGLGTPSAPQQVASSARRLTPEAALARLGETPIESWKPSWSKTALKGPGGMAGFAPFAFAEWFMSRNIPQEQQQQMQLEEARRNSMPLTFQEAQQWTEYGFGSSIWKDPLTGQWYMRNPQVAGTPFFI